MSLNIVMLLLLILIVSLFFPEKKEEYLDDYFKDTECISLEKITNHEGRIIFSNGLEFDAITNNHTIEKGKKVVVMGTKNGFLIVKEENYKIGEIKQDAFFTNQICIVKKKISQNTFQVKIFGSLAFAKGQEELNPGEKAIIKGVQKNFLIIESVKQ